MIRVAALCMLAAGSAVIAACGSSSGSATSSPAATATPASPTVSTHSTSLGIVLTNQQGLTLYYFTPEKGGTIACTGTCATTWPALTTPGTASGPSTVTGTFATVNLPDGSKEVTYNGWPLHTYAKDTSPGQTTGQGVGGKWFVATPSLTAEGNPGTPSPSGAP